MDNTKLKEMHQWCLENLEWYQRYDSEIRFRKRVHADHYDHGALCRDMEYELMSFMKRHREKRDKAERKIGRLRRKLEREIKELQRTVEYEDGVLAGPVAQRKEMDKYFNILVDYHRDNENEEIKTRESK